MTVKCFFIEPTDRCRRWLLRYSRGGGKNVCPGMPGEYGYHNAMAFLDEVPRALDSDGAHWTVVAASGVPHADRRWPVKCEACEYVFTDEDEWQDFDRQIYVDRATGKEYTLADKVPGMMWDACWMPENWKGPDGRSLVVVCPNGHEWMIDSQASNCTMKDDVGPFASAHRCWVRHGEPPLVTVDKAGRTCAAGAGSIQAGDYHGFLRGGQFT